MEVFVAGSGWTRASSLTENVNGDVTTLTYPRCIAASCNGATTSSRVVG
jgi:hypothetical protein